MRILLSPLLMLAPLTASAERLKDLGFVRGVRDNDIVGYGLVVGLKGTGDDLGGTGRILVHQNDDREAAVSAFFFCVQNFFVFFVTTDRADDRAFLKEQIANLHRLIEQATRVSTHV